MSEFYLINRLIQLFEGWAIDYEWIQVSNAKQLKYKLYVFFRIKLVSALNRLVRVFCWHHSAMSVHSWRQQLFLYQPWGVLLFRLQFSLHLSQFLWYFYSLLWLQLIWRDVALEEEIYRAVYIRTYQIMTTNKLMIITQMLINISQVIKNISWRNLVLKSVLCTHCLPIVLMWSPFWHLIKVYWNHFCHRRSRVSAPQTTV